MEETLFVTERPQSRVEIASYLRSIADKLDEGGTVTLSSGADSVTLEIPEQSEFEIKAERETDDGEPELSLEFEIEWNETGERSGLTIE